MRQGIWLTAALALGLMLGWLEMPGAQEKPKKLNSYTGNPEAIKEGKRLFAMYGCSFCHGRLGSGDRQGPPLNDDDWKFGGDDATLMKLVKGEIKQSKHRNFGEDLEEDQIWEILAYIRSLYKGDPNKIVW